MNTESIQRYPDCPAASPTALEFKLYEALREAHDKLRGEPGESVVLEVLDSILWPAVYGDDDVIERMDSERIRRAEIEREDERITAHLLSGGASNDFARIAADHGPFKVTWPNGTYTHFVPRTDIGGVEMHSNCEPGVPF